MLFHPNHSSICDYCQYFFNNKACICLYLTYTLINLTMIDSMINVKVNQLYCYGDSVLASHQQKTQPTLAGRPKFFCIKTPKTVITAYLPEKGRRHVRKTKKLRYVCTYRSQRSFPIASAGEGGTGSIGIPHVGNRKAGAAHWRVAAKPSPSEGVTAGIAENFV